MGTRQIGRLLLYLAASFVAAAIGGSVTTSSVRTWYPSLRKPGWTPPSWLFAPVWTILYVHMAVAAWLLEREARRHPERNEAARSAIAAWWTQLVLNVGWSVVFFGMRRIGLATSVIAALWAAILTTILLAWRVSKIPALLLAPYLAWTSFASALNVRIWQLNRERD